MYYKSILEVIGNTPLVELSSLASNPDITFVAKLEYLNPGGSIKDRIGLPMIEKAEKEGKLKKGGTIVEPTSGNTGVGLAMAAAIKGYKTVFVMPDKQSDEKRNILRAFGAKVIVTPTNVGPDDERSYYKVSDRLSKEIPNAVKPNQYKNSENPNSHFQSTGPEIWNQTEGKITHLVCGIGTGGTITGIARYLKEKNPNIKIVGVDPIGSVFYNLKKKGKYLKSDIKPYKIEGVGEDFVPTTLDLSLVDEIIQVGDRESFLAARALARNEGLLTGGSSGMAFVAAQKLSKKLKKGIVVVIFADSGKSYLSKIYNDDWMRENGFLESNQGITILNVLKNKAGSKIISVNPEDSVKSTINIMKKYDVSQVLVIKKGRLLGKVNEKELLEGLYARRIGPTNKVSVIVDEKVQRVSKNETIDRVSQLLTIDNLVVVTGHSNKPLGVVTRIDLINYYS